MSINIYPSIAKVKRNGVYENLPGFVQQSGDADIEAMIATKESDTQAQYPHPQGSYFILNDVLYQADIDIPVSGTIAVGTNCHVAVLANDVEKLFGKVNPLEKNQLDYSIYDAILFNKPFFHGKSRTASGIKYTWDENFDNITIEGSNSSSANYNVYYSKTALPKGMNAGEIYYIKAYFPTRIRVIITAYFEDGTSSEIARTSLDECFKIPENAKGLLIQIRTMSGVNINETYPCFKIINYGQNYPYNFTSMSMFPNIGVLGDSFASGSLHTQSEYVLTNVELSWPQILARKLGITATNFSQGGMTTKTFLTNENVGLPKLLDSPQQQLYIIAFGINDYNRILDGSYTMGDASDIKEDYTQNPDTFYGNYARIINSIMNYAPYCKIVCCGAMRSAQMAINTNIEEIANICGVPYIRPLDDNFFVSLFYQTSIYDGHPVAYAYAGIAEAVERLINNCVIINRDYFDDYFGYPLSE